MKKRLLYILLSAGLVAAAALAAFTLPASAELREIQVRLVTGEVVTITVDVPPGTPLSEIEVPGVVTNEPAQPAPAQPAPQQPAPAPQSGPAPRSPGGSEQERTTDRRKPRRGGAGGGGPFDTQPLAEGPEDGKRPKRNPLRNPDGSPTPTNPGFFDALPGPSTATGVPNFVIRKFRVPIFLLPIYQAAGIQYGIRWEILAAINEIETDYGRNLNVSSAGALGWMQFIPSSWKAYGVDANKDGVKDPYNPVDAIFAAARYLDAAGYEDDVRRAIFAYNHADWYVDSVMLRARLIAGVPADLVGSLTGLTEGRFPVYARAWYADDLAERGGKLRPKTPVNMVESDDSRRDINIFSRSGAPVVAVNDGRIEKIGHSKRLGQFVRLQDVYGNRYTYAHLGSLAKVHPVPRESLKDAARALRAHQGEDRRPTKAASAGRQAPRRVERPEPVRTRASMPIKERLFAHPNAQGALQFGGMEQMLDAKARRTGKYETYANYFARPYGIDPREVRLERLRKGSRVIGGTILGHVGATLPGKAPHVSFSIRPAGRGAPRIDPKPILDGWKLLEATAVYRASGRNALRRGGGLSIGQVLMMPKPLLERRVLADARIEIYDCGRDDVRAGRVDRRVLATLAFLAESGMRPTVTSLQCGHSYFTAGGSVSHHSSGNAVDIAAINGVPIIGHQEAGGITEQAVRRLMGLQGTMRPDQIISLLDFGANTIAMADHADHIHVGFQPRFGTNRKLGRQAEAVLRPGQWDELLARLRDIENPVVPTAPSRWSIPTHRARKLQRLRELGRRDNRVAGGD
jgi:hypothetical protein